MTFAAKPCRLFCGCCLKRLNLTFFDRSRNTTYTYFETECSLNITRRSFQSVKYVNILYRHGVLDLSTEAK